jgi:hypothetical protein
MNTEQKTFVTQTLPITGLLGIAFIVLKLCKVIAWSWWWVTAPFWVPSVVVLAITLVALLIAGLTWVGIKILGG